MMLNVNTPENFILLSPHTIKLTCPDFTVTDMRSVK